MDVSHLLEGKQTRRSAVFRVSSHVKGSVVTSSSRSASRRTEQSRMGPFTVQSMKVLYTIYLSGPRPSSPTSMLHQHGRKKERRNPIFFPLISHTGVAKDEAEGRAVNMFVLLLLIFDLFYVWFVNVEVYGWCGWEPSNMYVHYSSCALYILCCPIANQP